MTQEEYISRAKETHKDFYDYTDTEYINSKTNIIVNCPIHGKFTVNSGKHILGMGCKQCRRQSLLEEKQTLFLEKCRKKFDNKYDYSKVKFNGIKEDIIVGCPIHGEFTQLAYSHKLKGCPECGRTKGGLSRRITPESFLYNAKNKHGDKYDYTNVKYTLSDTPVEIICPKHGSFFQMPQVHLRGCGCPSCANELVSIKRRSDEEGIISRIKEIHGDKYDYSEIKYVNMHTKVKLTCKKHGEFFIIPNNLIHNQGCKKCGLERSNDSIRISVEEGIRRANIKHGNKYIYNIDSFKGIEVDMEITCPKHGIFLQKLRYHYGGTGCPKCGLHKLTTMRLGDTDNFIKKSNIIHDNKYDYSKSDFKGVGIDLEIICPIHGSFWQIPNNHYKGCGCPKCGNGESKWETEITEYIKNDLYLEANKTRKIISPLEIDIFVPEANLAIEANGLWFHSTAFEKVTDQTHLNKTELCNAKNISLFHIFEDEWKTKKDIVKSIISNKCNKNSNKIYARKCEIKEITYKQAQIFIDDNHLQGSAVSSYNIGLFHKDELVSVMTFGKSRYDKKYEWELIRFCNQKFTTVIGGASKLLAFFKKAKLPKSIISYANKRFSNGKIYEVLGFENNHEDSRPNYFYIKASKRYSRQKFQKHKLSKLLEKFDPDLTEYQNMENNGYYRIWDCGNKIYTWTACELV
jgi:hypothetical protein